MTDKDKKELNETELEKAAGGIAAYSDCDNFEPKRSGTSLGICVECSHFVRKGVMGGVCDLNPSVYNNVNMR